jgi:hypothetical protein
MRDAGHVKAMNGRLFKYTAYEHNWGTRTRWFVRIGKFRYVVTRDDEELRGIYKVYREWDQDGNLRNEFLAYSPDPNFGLRICATETQRLVAGTKEEAKVTVQ